MLIGQPNNEDLHCVNVAQVFYIDANRCESLDIAPKRLTFPLNPRPEACHIPGLPFMVEK